MLEKFKVKNFKKFKEELIFDFTKVKKYTFNENIIKNNILNMALIYGSNGSGKSNLGFAMLDIIFHTTDNEKIKDFYNNYLYGNGILSDRAEFTYEFNFGGEKIIYIYSKKNVDELLKEELYLNNKKVLYIDRGKKEIELQIEESSSLRTDNIFNSNLSLLKYVLSNVLFENNSVYYKLKTFLEKMLWFRSVEANNYLGYKIESNSITNEILGILEADKNEEIIQYNLNKFENFLKEAGVDLVLRTREAEGIRVIEVEIDSEDKKEKRYINFFQIASSGTLALAAFYSWYKKLDEISFVFIDEFDAFYHYKLSKLIIKKLKEKNNTQVILTTHSTNLMNNELLRPDAYFILKNNKLKSIPELTDKELREAHNIEKLFKSGAFDE